MEDTSKAKQEFNQRLSKLRKDNEPALYDTTLKEIVIYEKLMEIQDQLNKVTEKIEKK